MQLQVALRWRPGLTEQPWSSASALSRLGCRHLQSLARARPYRSVQGTCHSSPPPGQPFPERPARTISIQPSATPLTGHTSAEELAPKYDGLLNHQSPWLGIQRCRASMPQPAISGCSTSFAAICVPDRFSEGLKDLSPAAVQSSIVPVHLVAVVGAATVPDQEYPRAPLPPAPITKQQPQLMTVPVAPGSLAVMIS